MSELSKAERAAMQKKLDERLKSLRANSDRPRKPIAMTLRLNPARYTRLSAHAAEYTPRRSFQAIIVDALDAYLGE